MPNPCCDTMRSATLTQADLERDPLLPDATLDVREWKPLVEWADHVGAFVIGHTVIFYCPWCGTRLPERIEKATDEARKSGTWIDVSPEGQLTVTVKGEPADPEAFLAELKAATKQQD